MIDVLKNLNENCRLSLENQDFKIKLLEQRF